MSSSGWLDVKEKEEEEEKEEKKKKKMLNRDKGDGRGGKGINLKSEVTEKGRKIGHTLKTFLKWREREKTKKARLNNKAVQVGGTSIWIVSVSRNHYLLRCLMISFKDLVEIFVNFCCVDIFFIYRIVKKKKMLSSQSSNKTIICDSWC